LENLLAMKFGGISVGSAAHVRPKIPNGKAAQERQGSNAAGERKD
jgi:hypothetical protein